MLLSEKLKSLTKENTAYELSEMLQKSQVSVSWLGKRFVSFDGYEGYIEINQIALKYFDTANYHQNGDRSLGDRLACASFCGRIQKLYCDSDRIIANGFIPEWCKDPMTDTYKNEFSNKFQRLFEFTPEEFNKLWPDAEPETTRLSVNILNDDLTKKWIPSMELVEAALKKMRSLKNLEINATL